MVADRLGEIGGEPMVDQAKDRLALIEERWAIRPEWVRDAACWDSELEWLIGEVKRQRTEIQALRARLGQPVSSMSSDFPQVGDRVRIGSQPSDNKHAGWVGLVIEMIPHDYGAMPVVRFDDDGKTMSFDWGCVEPEHGESPELGERDD